MPPRHIERLATDMSSFTNPSEYTLLEDRRNLARRDADFVLDALDASTAALESPVSSIESLDTVEQQLSRALGKASFIVYEAAVMLELAKVAHKTDLGLAMARATRTYQIAESGYIGIAADDFDSRHKLHDIMRAAQEIHNSITETHDTYPSHELSKAA